MFTAALDKAKECITKDMNHGEYVEQVKQSNLIEYVDIIIIDLDAYERLTTIMKKDYLK